MNTLFVRSRNRDFMMACRRRLAALNVEGHAPQTLDEVYAVADYVLAQPAPGYYVDYYRACHILVHALCDNRPPEPKYESGQMWADMYRDLLEAIKRHPTTPTRALIFSMCAGEIGNPRFYISQRTAYKLIRQNLTKSYSL